MARSPISISEAVNEFVTLKSAGKAAGTARSYEIALGHLTRHTGPDLGVRSLTAKHLEAHFLTGPKARRRAVALTTFNKERSIAQTFSGFLVRRGYTLTDLMAEVRPLKVPAKHRLRLGLPELRQVLEVQRHPRDRLTMALVMNTGLRASDLASIRVGDVSLPYGELDVVIRKTGARDVLPITKDLDTELRRWFVWYQERMRVQKLSPDWFLLPAKSRPVLLPYPRRKDVDVFAVELDPTTAARYDGLLRPVKLGLASLGITDSQQGLHTIRRSVARVYYDYLTAEGGDTADQALRMVQVLLGHASVKTTELYIGVEVEREKRNHSLRGKSFLSYPAVTDKDGTVHDLLQRSSGQ